MLEIFTKRNHPLVGNYFALSPTVKYVQLIMKICVFTLNWTMEEINFSNKEEFLSWKEQIEKNERTSYFVKTSKVLSNGNKKSYLRCHRSGKYISLSNTRVSKPQGSCKIGTDCPSTMEVLETEVGVNVIYFRTHVGHDMDLKYLSISQSDKDHLQRKIAEGIPFERILDDVRDSVDKNLERRHLLTRRDLLNLSNTVNMKSERRHKDDGISLVLFLEESSKLGDMSPVVYHKLQGVSHDSLDINDFILVLMTPAQKYMLSNFSSKKICIDTTHGTNGYDFNLTSIMVVDEFDNGFPAAFCLSNRISEIQIKIFFEAIRNQVGKIGTKVFMSDDYPAYYNAWEKTMGASDKHLLCTWHVDKNWREALVRIRNPEKKVTVYKFLRTLLEETNEDKFNLLLSKFIEDGNDDEDVSDFCKYFVQYYASRCELWAYCYRLHSGINTNMFLEALHKVIKHIYMKGKVNKRIDSCINLLLKLVKDKTFDRFTKLVKGCSNKKSSEIHKRHKKGNAFPRSNISKVSGNKWSIQSEKCSQVVYVVEKNNLDCNKCQLICRICNICLHCYSCTCIDCIVLGNMCKHIHAVNLHEGNGISCVERKEQDILNEIQNNALFDSISVPQSSTSNVKTEALKSKFNLGLTLLDKQNISEDTISKIDKKLDSILSLLNNESSNLTLVQRTEPPNKKLKLQPIYSTKNKYKKSQTALTKPSLAHKHAIVEAVSSGTDIVNISSGSNDHSYTK